MTHDEYPSRGDEVSLSRRRDDSLRIPWRNICRAYQLTDALSRSIVRCLGQVFGEFYWSVSERHACNGVYCGGSRANNVPQNPHDATFPFRRGGQHPSRIVPAALRALRFSLTFSDRPHVPPQRPIRKVSVSSDNSISPPWLLAPRRILPRSIRYRVRDN